ncbi:amidase (plasmid) [Roseivivax marinus]|uniref:amidase n=1 Tax=Roseivivax marinus TaxID=1379903 RepID=UPI001F03E5B2|nr:amidase [Roseivivax marinus]UMA67153.1 amidase [Roseivivax marinus]
MSDLADMGFAALGRLMERRATSSREIVAACLARIDALNPQLDAFLDPTAERALAEAETRDRERAAGQVHGPLHGIPVAVKDIIDVAGLPTTCHSRAASDSPAARDAFVVARLRKAGAVILGKTALHEYATGGPSFDLPWPPARNPWNRDRHPGGSSSGSGAAVAAGMVPAALGTDTAGSVRHPATACGIVGMKPTYGAISRQGVFPLAASLDQVGPMTRTVADNAVLFDACTGWDPADPASRTLGPVSGQATPDLRGLRIAVLDDFNAEADPEILESFSAARTVLTDLGAHVESVATLPVSRFNDCARLLIQTESFAVHGPRLRASAAAYGWRARTKLLAGAFVDAELYLAAQAERRRLTESLRAALLGFDAAICLSSFHHPAHIEDDAEIDATYDRQARIVFNLTGDPAIAVPCGMSRAGLPIGFQIAAPFGRDAMVYRIAGAYEVAFGGDWPRYPYLAS